MQVAHRQPQAQPHRQAQTQAQMYRQEAYWLLSHILSVPQSKLLLDAKRTLTKQEQSDFKLALAKRKQGTPLAYVLGEWDFYGHTFYMDEGVLIPRPDSEALLDFLLSRYPDNDQPSSVLDLGCGSGAIGISLALRRKHWRLHLADLSAKALALARRNIAKFSAELDNDIQTYHSDLFDAIPPRRKFDIIIANLPYISPSELLTLPDLASEPRSALDGGGGDGLNLIRRLLGEAPAHLKRGGLLLAEHGYKQSSQVLAAARRASYVSPEVICDLAGRKRALAVRYLNRKHRD